MIIKIFIYKIDLNIHWYKKVLFSIMSKYIIYKIYCDDCDFIYVGSTKNFTRRKQQHKINCNQTDKSNMKLYKNINEYGGWNNWKMICIEECNETIISRRQAEQKEEEWRVKLNAQLNKWFWNQIIIIWMKYRSRTNTIVYDSTP